MTDIIVMKNIGALVDVVTSVEPQSSAAATINGTGIDRQLHGNALSCVLHTAGGAITGAPTTSSIVSKLQDSADNSTFADYKPDGANVAQAAAVTAANTENSLAIDLTNARRFIRVVSTVSFTGGASPAQLVNADVILAGERVLPAV